jgi:AraC family transcriptional regulator of adaptative response/methylated-DNA-[protein]-cysteine methyltransferase
MPLDDLAARLSMSPAHFQRVFSRWVGVSPKRYQQYLTLDLARRLLAERFTLLDTAAEAGLSGTGRLHDLFLAWEAMSPGEYARGGAGLTIRYGWFPTPFGEALAMGTDRGLCGLGFVDDCGRDAAMADLCGRWPRASFVEDRAALAPWVEAAFAGKGEARLHMIGAPFQIKVWEALLTVPSGQVTTYSELARAIGHPTAVRAVGTAVGRNPVSWLIPCHRALRKTGGLGGYHWGLPVKRAMLAWEAARAEAKSA